MMAGPEDWGAVPDQTAPEKPAEGPVSWGAVSDEQPQQGFFSRMWERGRIDPDRVPRGFLPAELRTAPFYKEIGDAFGQGWHEGFGDHKLGLKPEDIAQLQEHKWFRQPGEVMNSWRAPYQAMTELLMNTVWDTGDLLFRTGSGLLRGGQRSVEVAFGGGQLGRDIAAIPEAFFGTPFHPLGVPKSFPEPASFVRETPIKPIEGSPNPSLPRVQAAQTGLPEVDAILNDPKTSHVIENVVVDRSHTVPYTAGGSTPLENPTMYIDRRFPTEFTVRSLSDSKKTVTFDPAEPFAIHENIEQHVMETLIKGGMDKQTAYKVAHFGFAEVAEGAWYAAHDIDQAAAEAAYKPHMDRIQKGKADAVPPDLYKDPYPHDTPSAAKHEALAEPGPTPEEMQRALEILRQDREGPYRVTEVT